MKRFKYEAKKGKELIKGILSADSQAAALDKINEMGLLPVQVFEEGVRGGANLFGRGVRNRSLTVFYQQLGRLARSGIPLLAALTVTAEQTEDRKLQSISETVKEEVRHGKSFAAALAEHAPVFDSFAIAMVELGENTGHLDDALTRLADCHERRSSVLQKVRNALVYPALVASLGLFAVIFLLTYVVPQFSKLFEEFGQELPWLTRVLLGISGWIQHYGLMTLLAMGVLGIIFHSRFKSASQKVGLDRWKMSLPLVGKMIFMAQFAAFARSMEMLLKGGIPLLKALKIAVPVVSNGAMKEDLSGAMRRVEQGSALSGALKHSGKFQLFAVHLLLIGEETGRLEESFNDIADWYDQRVDEATRLMTQLVEPITLLGVGLFLGLIAMAILLPVFSIDAIVFNQ
ncbi:MAG: type II secretion system F family protein [Candidatus Omnitrophota bacterium]